MQNLRTVLITGVSSGIGHGLAHWYLKENWQVLGISRRRPKDLAGYKTFHFTPLDLSVIEAIDVAVREFLVDVARLDLIVLNAGILGEFGDLAAFSLDELEYTMRVNVWSNKFLLDTIFAAGKQVRQVVGISSEASVNGNRVSGGYAMSKAALNMLMQLYAREQPETHFTAFAPGLVDTDMQELLRELHADERYPSLEVLRSKRGTDEMPDPTAAAPKLAEAMARLPKMVDSGAYTDVRKMTET